MIVLDANAVIALLDPKDRHHHRATELLAEHAKGGYRMHQLTLAEVLLGAVRSGRGNQRFADLTSLGIETHTPGANEPLTLAELRATTALKMPDCCVLAIAQLESLPIATFDDPLARGQKARIADTAVVRLPSRALGNNNNFPHRRGSNCEAALAERPHS